MSPIPYEQFAETYRQAVTDVLAWWTPEMQAELAAHCRGWAPDRFDFGAYLRASTPRYWRPYRAIAERGDAMSVCDVGGFWGVFPVTLKRLGHDVAMTEALKYYSASFDRLFGFLRGEGVRVEDFDPFEDDARPPGAFDALTLMAVVEHYPHSLRTAMRHAKAMMNPGALLYIEAPNIAYWPRRIALLKGRTPLTPVRDIYESRVPFIGHHHEMTLAELHDLADLAGLRIVREHCYNYTPRPLAGVRDLLGRPFEWLAYRLSRTTREVLSIECVTQDDA